MPTTEADRHAAEICGTVHLARARELGAQLSAAADEIERRRELLEPIVEALVEHGLFRLLLPRSLGGAELPPAAYVPVIEEIAKHDASVAWCLGQANGCAMTAAYLDQVAACEIFGGERGIVAWGPPGGPAKARRDQIEVCGLEFMGLGVGFDQRDVAQPGLGEALFGAGEHRCRNVGADHCTLLAHSLGERHREGARAAADFEYLLSGFYARARQ